MKATFSRRDFIKTAGAAGTGLLLQGSMFNKVTSLSSKKRYAIVGTGHRSEMWQEAIYTNYGDSSEIAGLCDTNLGRLLHFQACGKKYTGKDVPLYNADEFDKMIKETKPETVIVTTVDSFHHLYIVRAMELGCDVITEKPMTNTDERCRYVLEGQRRTGRKITVSFNYRYTPARTQVKDLLMSGSIGDILSVDFHWMLNTFHGTDYFRRWHSQKKFSSGLMLHKATHHFDLVNWWLSAVPVAVSGMGKREFYTPEMAKRIGLESHHERCHTCPEKSKCSFELNLSENERLKALYLNCEKYDGYYRDQCVFRPDIDIEDTMNVLVRYSNNATLAYSLNAFNAWEGYYVIFNGTKGRLEHRVEEKIYVAGDGREQGGIKPGGESTKIIPLRGKTTEVKVWKGEGGHGGGDKVMLDDIFNPGSSNDKYMRCADQRAGAYSLLTGVAANYSFKEHREILIDDLVKDIGMPDYPAMPAKTASLGMPEKI